VSRSGSLFNWPLALVIGLILVAATGCVESRARHTPVPSPTPTATPTPEPTVTPTPVPTETAVPPVPTATSVPPTATPEPTATPVPTATIAPSTGTFNLALEFEGIGDESVVYAETVLLRGVTSADAIVSVNGVILEVQPDGTFELTLALDVGPNLVDVVASDLDGSTINYLLAIVSIPPEEAV
ncbi:MAG: hypothetical protein V3T49_05065, partial [Dehalococcoidia bacterium]